MHTWEDAILTAIQSLGGRADLQQIYERLPRFVDLSADHLRETKWGGRPAYQHTVRYLVSSMTRSGKLVRVARGTYGLP